MNDIKSFNDIINEEWGNKDKFAIDNETLWNHLNLLKDQVKDLIRRVEMLEVTQKTDRLTR